MIVLRLFSNKAAQCDVEFIESFAESGIKIKDWDYDELIIDGEPKDGNSLGNKSLDDEILGWLEENENEIEWEFDD